MRSCRLRRNRSSALFDSTWLQPWLRRRATCMAKCRASSQAAEFRRSLLVASGVFSVKQQTAAEWTYVEGALGRWRPPASEVCIQSLTSYSDQAGCGDLYYGDPCHFFDLCKTRSQTRHLAARLRALRFTILIRTEPVPVRAHDGVIAGAATSSGQSGKQLGGRIWPLRHRGFAAAALVLVHRDNGCSALGQYRSLVLSQFFRPGELQTRSLSRF